MTVSMRPLLRHSCWFRILPRFKLRSEGEIVRIGDQVRRAHALPEDVPLGMAEWLTTYTISACGDVQPHPYIVRSFLRA